MELRYGGHGAGTGAHGRLPRGARESGVRARREPDAAGAGDRRQVAPGSAGGGTAASGDAVGTRAKLAGEGGAGGSGATHSGGPKTAPRPRLTGWRPGAATRWAEGVEGPGGEVGLAGCALEKEKEKKKLGWASWGEERKKGLRWPRGKEKKREGKGEEKGKEREGKEKGIPRRISENFPKLRDNSQEGYNTRHNLMEEEQGTGAM